MNNEFKKILNGNVTRYVLENASSGGTGSGSVASVSMPVGGTRKRGDNLIAQEADNKTVPASTPRNFVAKNAKTGGAGAHRDKKKEQKQGVEKHKKPYMEDRDHPDHEIQMASSELMSIAKDAESLLGMVRRYSEQDGLDAWQQSKITKAADYLNSVLQSINGEQQGVAEDEVEESGLQYFTGVKKHGEKYMKAAAAAGREGASQEELGALKDRLSKAHKGKAKNEDWSKKYKSSINCSHPKGFSQKAHCAGKNKHNESIMMEMVCEDCGMCETHGNLNEIKKGQKDSNGFTKCWPGKHADGTKKSATTGKQVRNCVPNEDVTEGELNEYTPLSGDFGVYIAAALAAGKVGQAAYDWAKQKWKEHQSKNADTGSEKDMDEGLGKWARNAALAGAMALGGAGAHAGSWSPMDVPAGGHNQLPDIVAHVKFKVGDQEINKEINLGSHYRSPGQAGEELKNFLNSKGIKFYQYSLERVKPKANDKIDNSPATSDMKGSMDTTEPAATGPSTDNYMAKDNDPERGPSMGGKFAKEDSYFESLQNMLERSVSQAQHNLMVGVANNPGYAQKVKVKQQVGQEFAQADAGYDISKLPIRVPKKK